MPEGVSIALFAGGALLIALLVIVLFGRRGVVRRVPVSIDLVDPPSPVPPAVPEAPVRDIVPPPPPPPSAEAPPSVATAAPPPAPATPLSPLPPEPQPSPAIPAMVASRRPAARPGEPAGLKLEFQPMRAGIEQGLVAVELNLTIKNPGPETAANLRLRPGLITASAEQEAQMAAFHGSSPLGGSAFQPFTLVPGAEQRVPIRLTLPVDAVHVVRVGDRPMFVPIVMIDIGWRGGLSLKRMGADFMVGIAPNEEQAQAQTQIWGQSPGQGARLGPFWLDREARMFEEVTARLIRRAK